MNFVQKNKNLLLLIFFICIGILLRIWGLDKPEGMWFDEMNTYLQSKIPLLDIFRVFFTKHIHTPLFYIILHFWMKVFGESDLTLRILPVIFGVLTIPVVYLCGRELKCERTALLAAFFVSINSLLIYYSQEVRMYSLITLFSSLIVLFLLRIGNNPTKGTLIGLILSNAGLLYTHSISFVFVFFEFLVFGLYFFFKQKDRLKPLFITGIFTLLIYSPYLYFRFFSFISNGLKYSGVTCQWWSEFTFSKILFAFGDNFSPFLVANNLPPDSFFDYIFKSPEIFGFSFIFSIIPMLIGIFGILISILSKRKAHILVLLVCTGFVLVFASASIMGKVVFISRYIIELTPILLLFCAWGLVNLKNKTLSKILISLFLVINIFYLTVASSSSPKLSRSSGYLPAANLLNKYNVKRDDYLISIGYKKEFFYKYLNTKDFDNFYYLDSWNFHFFPAFLDGTLSLKDTTDLGYLSYKYLLKTDLPADTDEKFALYQKKVIDSKINKDYLEHKNYRKYSQEYYKDTIGNPENIFINTSIKNEIFSKIDGQNKLCIILHKGLVVTLEEDDIQKIKKMVTEKDYNEIKKINLIYMIHTRVAYDLLELAKKELELVDREEAGVWKVFIFRKKDGK